jgi:predicted dehydrogenase
VTDYSRFVAGVTFLDIGVGHILDAFQYLLGHFTSVSATSASFRKEVTLKETGEVIPATGEDHVAFSGFLDTEVFVSVSARSGYACVKGARFIWEIQGTQGLVRLVDDPEEVHQFINVADLLVYLNGELVPLEGKGGLEHNISRGWTEFSRGKNGIYPTLDDAVKLHELLDAIRKSASEGARVML